MHEVANFNAREPAGQVCKVFTLTQLRHCGSFALFAGRRLQFQTQSWLGAENGKNVLHFPKVIPIHTVAINSQNFVSRSHAFEIGITLGAYSAHKTALANDLILESVVNTEGMLWWNEKG